MKALLSLITHQVILGVLDFILGAKGGGRDHWRMWMVNVTDEERVVCVCVCLCGSGYSINLEGLCSQVVFVWSLLTELLLTLTNRYSWMISRTYGVIFVTRHFKIPFLHTCTLQHVPFFCVFPKVEEILIYFGIHHSFIMNEVHPTLSQKSCGKHCTLLTYFIYFTLSTKNTPL